jgi:glycosyltransferase involved in cell wall biosynthesis
MRIAFDSRGASDPSGIGRYVRCLLDGLRTTADGHEILEAHRPRRVDAYHSPWLEGAALRTSCPQVVTLHDLVPLKRASEYLRTGMRFRLRYLAVQRAARVIVPTHVVAADAERHLAIPPDRIAVVPEAAAAAMRPRPSQEVAAARARHHLPDEYLVWVGGLEHPDPRKRVAALAHAPRELPLVLVGPAKEWAHELPDVVLTGKVTDDDLAAILTGARALVCPSDDEGFGLPTVEALACGTPVVACDIPALREVLGERAQFVARDDVAGLLALAATAQKPAPPPPAWTWDDAARATWAVYEAAAATRRPITRLDAARTRPLPRRPRPRDGTR